MKILGKLWQQKGSRGHWRDAIEPDTAARLVEAVYRNLLRREPDAQGMQHWLGFLRRGGDFDAMLTGFVNSPEFRNLPAAPPPPPLPLPEAAVPRIPVGLDRVAPAMPEEDREAFAELVNKDRIWQQDPAVYGAAEVRGSISTSLRFAVAGNCQAGMVARCLQAMVGGPMPRRLLVDDAVLTRLKNGSNELAELFASHDKVLVQPWLWDIVGERHQQFRDKLELYPFISFEAFQPDLVPILRRDNHAAFEDGPTLRCHSSLTFLGWKAGLDARQTVALFNARVFGQLGFFDVWPHAVRSLMEEGRVAGLPLEGLFDSWMAREAFMYCHVHAKLFAMADVTRALLRRMGVDTLPGEPVAQVHDLLANGVIWPVYPELAAAVGVTGGYSFKLLAPYFMPDQPVHQLGLEEYIERSFAAYDQHANEHGAENLHCPRLELPAYRELLDTLRTQGLQRDLPAATAPQAAAAPQPNPYHGLPSQRFWRRAIQDVAPQRVDPVDRVKFQIDPVTAIATAGSCFAQHIASRLKECGFKVLETESPPPGMSIEDARRSQYGVFCARYGNLYTVRHLLQLLQRAYGEFVPVDSAWLRPDGRLVDPFRPKIEDAGFGSPAELEASRALHLAAVRRMFETMDLFVFTLGLTEAWRSKVDGAVFPLAPGVAGGAMDFERYEFVNFNAAEVDADLAMFLQRLARINPAARVLLTVSPVPLAATYAERNVLAATTYSKAVLRVAAEQVTQRHPNCDYFPSYEVITGSYNRGAYFASDLRSVTDAGVDHVMRLFFQHYARQLVPAPDGTVSPLHGTGFTRLICEEELLAAAAK